MLSSKSNRKRLIAANFSSDVHSQSAHMSIKVAPFSLQPFLEQSIKEKESFANKVAVDDEQNHVMESADLENKQASPDGDYHVILDPSDAEKSIEVN